MLKDKIPDSKDHLRHLEMLLKKRIPFTYVRFSDGEIEILRNRFLEINERYVLFRGKKIKNKYPIFDQKKFEPSLHSSIRKDLISSSLYSGKNYFKGIPTEHNKAINDKEFMIRLNGGTFNNLTFSDLLINSNYKDFLSKITPHFKIYDVFVIANHRASFNGCLKNAKHIPIPDNFFNNYFETKKNIINTINKLKKNALILSSASSLSNIIGFELFQIRKDLTFIDIGTSLNAHLSLDEYTRDYHNQFKNKTIFDFFKNLTYRLSRNYKIKW